MWLLRGLSFTCKSLQNLQATKDKELKAAFLEGYEGSLKPFHNFVVKGVFSVRDLAISSSSCLFDSRLQVAMSACPYRKDFYTKLAADPNGGEPESQERLDAELDKWLAGLHDIVTRMQKFYADGKYDKGL